jgi:hypothetical protein
MDPLRDFLKNEGTILDIALIKDESDHPVYQYLSKKFAYTDGKLKESLDTFLRVLLADVAPYMHSNSRIYVRHIEYLPAYSLFMFDSSAYITLYKTAPQRTNIVPSFKVVKATHSDFFQFLSDDHAELTRNSTTKTIEINKENSAKILEALPQNYYGTQKNENSS